MSEDDDSPAPTLIGDQIIRSRADSYIEREQANRGYIQAPDLTALPTAEQVERARRSLSALALELPGVVYDDVKAAWQPVLAAVAEVRALTTRLDAQQAVIDAARAWAVTYGPRADDTVITESVKNERRLELYFAVVDLDRAATANPIRGPHD
jgi:hypothetical protein